MNDTRDVVEVMNDKPAGGYIRIERSTGGPSRVVLWDVPPDVPFDEWDDFFRPMLLSQGEFETMVAAVREFMGWEPSDSD